MKHLMLMAILCLPVGCQNKPYTSTPTEKAHLDSITMVTNGCGVDFEAVHKSIVLDPCSYVIKGNVYSIPQKTTVPVLAPSRHFKRLDALMVDDFGDVYFVRGVPSEDPQAPVRNSHQIALTIILQSGSIKK